MDAALNYLGQAVEHGSVSAAWMRNDTDLASLKGDPRFEELLGQLEEREECAVA